MKLRKVLAGILAGSLIVANVPAAIGDISTVSASVTVGKASKYAYTSISNESLCDIKANSWSTAEGESNTVAAAFDGDTNTYWHQNYNANGEGSTDAATEAAPIWISAGFGSTKKVGKLTYQGRSNSMNIIQDYKIEVINSLDESGAAVTPSDDAEWEVVARGIFSKTTGVQSVEFTPVDATHIRLCAVSRSHSGGSQHVVASEIGFWEASQLSDDVYLNSLIAGINEEWSADGLNKDLYDGEKIEWILAQVDEATTDEKRSALIQLIESEKMDEALPFSDEYGVGVYLSDIPWTGYTSGWFATTRDMHGEGNNKISLKNIAGERVYFDKGVSTHAPASVMVDVQDYSLFRTFAGVDGGQSTSAPSNLSFNIHLDGTQTFTGEAMTANTPMTELNVDLSQVSSMKVEMNMGENDANDHASLGDAKLYTALAANPEITIEAPVSGESVSSLQGNDQYTVETVWTTTEGTQADTFENGQVYTMTATYTAQEGYCFTDTANGNTEMTVTSGDDSWTVAPTVEIGADRQTMTVSYRFAVNNNPGGFEATDVPVSNISNITTGTHEDPTNNTEWGDGDGAYVIDNNTNTKWHSGYTGVSEYQTDKFWIDFEMANVTKVDGIRVLPHSVNGQITKYEVWVSSADEATWGTDYKKVCEGTWDNNSNGTSTWKTAKFEAVEAKHVRLVAKETMNNNSGDKNKNIALREMRLTVPTSEVTYAEFLGAGLRMDHGASDYTKTSMRFGYVIPNIDGFTVDSWKWNWGIAEDALTGEVEGVNRINNEDGSRTSNLVVTDIPNKAYGTTVYSQLAVKYITTATDHTAGETLTVFTQVQERSVSQVADLINASTTATDEEKTYATGIKEAMAQ